jgi:anaerobic sulfite reductase subunit B
MLADPPLPYRVTRRVRETADTWTLELAARNGAIPEPLPGQFAMLYPHGIGEVPISVSGLGPDGVLVQTVRDVGAVTHALAAAGPGEDIGVRGPFGTSWPVAASEGADVVVAAGGLGLAPLRGAIRALAARREAYGRLLVLYGARTPRDLLFEDELRRWEDDGLTVHLTVDSAGPDWRGAVGVVSKLVARAEFDPSAAVALVCGPEVMMRFTVAALAERGLPGSRAYVSLERAMKCGVGHCGHCQLGPTLICRDGPVYRWDHVERWLGVREL